MVKRGENRSAQRTRRLIREAFCQLVQEKDASKITVTDIVKRADIHRSTFYTHYPDVNGLMEELEREAADHISEILSAQYEKLFDDPVEFIRSLNKNMDQEEFRTPDPKLCSQQAIDALIHLLVRYTMNIPQISDAVKARTDFQIQAYFFAGGIATAYKHWYLGELDCTLEDLAVSIGNNIAAFYRQSDANNEPVTQG